MLYWFYQNSNGTSPSLPKARAREVAVSWICTLPANVLDHLTYWQFLIQPLTVPRLFCMKLQELHASFNKR
jgi:hypothetical protein